ncbi:MAG: RidA family protein [Candidatus Rokubacteria bacterium]|nr:RidA family protein [Candidatus Rokubacteria bacterium]
MGAEARLVELDIVLPATPQPVANYVRAVRTGNLLFLAGHVPVRDGQLTYIGRLGKDLSVEEGYQAARLVGLNLLASARDALGSLDRVKRVVKVLGMVNSAEGFGDQPKVVNGFSDLMVEVFGEAGRHARSAVGMAGLPMGVAVEVEAILEVADAAGAGATRRAAAPPRRRTAPAPKRPAARRARSRRH